MARVVDLSLVKGGQSTGWSWVGGASVWMCCKYSLIDSEVSPTRAPLTPPLSHLVRDLPSLLSSF